MKLITKSKYIIGLQCPRYLWMEFNDKDNIPSLPETTQFRLDQGKKIEALAKQLYPGGISIAFDDFKENLKESKKALAKGLPLFEPGFMFGNCFARADVLVPNEGVWDIVEIKSGTNLKDAHICDVAFQKYVYQNKGIKIGRCYIMLLNKEYVRHGSLNLEKLFTKIDVTEKAEQHLEGMENRIAEMKKTIEASSPPEIAVGQHCKMHHPCPITECWESLPDNHVFCLHNGRKKCTELYEAGIVSIADIPEDFKLNEKHGIQRDCQINDRVHVDKEKLKSFLDTLEYPLYFLDFETFSTGIPMFDGLKPNSHVCFQFSLHVIEKPGQEPKHYEYLYKGNDDPRPGFLSALKKVIGNKGSVVVYYQQFEKPRLKELAEQFPEHNPWIENVLQRVADLLIPFKNFYYYNPEQQGSASLKAVLPALCGKDYSDLDIDNGLLASLKFYEMAYGECEDKVKVRQQLLKYCGLDTLAEVLIFKELEKLAN